MAVIVKVDLEKAQEFANKSVHILVGKKKQPVIFKVEVDETNLEEGLSDFKADKNIAILDYRGIISYLTEVDRGDFQGVYITRNFEFGNNIDEDDIVNALESVPKEFTVIAKLPEGYCDMRFVQEMSQKYPRVRFCGGNLFKLEGCNLSCCPASVLSEHSITIKNEDYIKTGCSCDLQVLPFNSVELVATSHVSKKAHKERKPSVKKDTTKKVTTNKKSTQPKKPTAKQQMKSLLSSWGSNN